MNAIGLSIITKMGCICMKEKVVVNSKEYVVRSTLGSGGFSVVELVEDPKSHKLLAMKRIVCHSAEDQKIALQEAEYYKQFNHSSIIKCYDFSLTGKPDLICNTTSEVLILLPYYSRGTLHSELERKFSKSESFSEKLVLSIFLRICLAVKAIHESKPHPLAHRDLKTANILLADDFTPVIMDLGSMARARVDVKSSREGRALQEEAAERSSMPYRAPELFNVESGSTVDERTDIWSLGCILYAMCFYKSPFDSVHERGDSVALAVASGTVNIPDDSPYSQDLHKLILRILKVNPLERPFVDDVISEVNKLIGSQENRV